MMMELIGLAVAGGLLLHGAGQFINRRTGAAPGHGPPGPEGEPDTNFHAKVAGVSFRNADRRSRQKIIREQACAGQSLTLAFEEGNKHDANAVAVLVMGTEQIGYLDRRLACDVRRWHAEGRRIEAHITAVTGGGEGELFGVNIRIRAWDPPPPSGRDDKPEPETSKPAPKPAAKRSGERPRKPRADPASAEPPPESGPNSG